MTVDHGINRDRNHRIRAANALWLPKVMSHSELPRNAVKEGPAAKSVGVTALGSSDYRTEAQDRR